MIVNGCAECLRRQQRRRNAWSAVLLAVVFVALVAAITAVGLAVHP